MSTLIKKKSVYVAHVNIDDRAFPQLFMDLCINIPFEAWLHFLCRQFDRRQQQFPEYWDQSEQQWERLYRRLISKDHAVKLSWKKDLEAVMSSMHRLFKHGKEFDILELSIKHGWNELLSYLLANYRLPYEQAHYLVKCAYRNNSVRSISILLNSGVFDGDVERGQKLVAYAARFGSPDAIEQVLAWRPDVLRQQPKTTLNPMLLATVGGRVDNIKLLMDKGCSVDSHLLYAAAMHCKSKKLVATMKALGIHHSTDNLNELLYISIRYGNDSMELLRFLTGLGAEVYVHPEQHDTAVHWAVRLANQVTCEFLLNHMRLRQGSQLLEAVDGDGCTPLLIAVRNVCDKNQRAYERIVRTLVEAGANVRASVDGFNALYFMGCYFPSEVMRAMKLGLDIKGSLCGEPSGRKSGSTVLHALVTAPHATHDVIEAVVASGVQVNAENGAGNTALHELAHYISQRRVCDVLLTEQQQHIFRRTPAYQQPLFYHMLQKRLPHYCVFTDNVRPDEMDIVRSLIHAGADLTCRNEQGCTPADLCFVAWIKKLLSEPVGFTA